jgi:hypothetical protein
MHELPSSIDNGIYRMDYGKLPGLLEKEIRNKLDVPWTKITEKWIFGSYPDNYAIEDHYKAEQTRKFCMGSLR